MDSTVRPGRLATLTQHLWPFPLAFFVVRVALESTSRPLPGSVVVAAGAVTLLGACVAARYSLRRRKASRASLTLWILLVYICWPSRQPLLAASLALIVGLSWLIRIAAERRPVARRAAPPRWMASAADGVVFVGALVLYVATLSPDVLPADSGEFQLVAARWGVAHPPGFPLYTLIGGLFVRLIPFSTPAYRLNLLSAVLAAGTLALVSRATRTWARCLVPGVQSTPLELASGCTAALALGTATTFWAQATAANIRTLATFCTALILVQLARFASATRRWAGEPMPAARREADRALVWLGVALGLGLGHHPSLMFASIPYVLYLVITEPSLAVEPRRWWRILAMVPVGLAPYVYLPLRGAALAPLAPAGLDTLDGFLHHVRAEGFAGDMFAYANATDLPHRLALLPTLGLFQFNTGLLLAAAAGLLLVAWRDWRLAGLLAGSLALHTFVSITYRAPQTVEYLMPAGYPPVAIAAGLAPVLALEVLGARRQRAHRGNRGVHLESIPYPEHTGVSALLSALVLTAGLLNGWAHGSSFAVLARDRSTRAHALPLLENAPSGTLILADWHWATPLWYLQQVEGKRPDVEVRYVYNVPGEEYRDTWRARVESAAPERPIILTHFYEFSGFSSEPWWTGFRIHARPLAAPTAPLTPLTVAFGDSLEVLGYHLETSSAEPGETIECVLAWRTAARLDQIPSFTLRLHAPDGTLVAQADQALDIGVQPGEVRFERLVLPLYPWLAPGDYTLKLGAYLAGAAGFVDLPAQGGEAATPTSALLTQLAVVPPRERPFTLHPHSTPFAGGAVLVGTDYDRSQPESLRVYLRLRGPISAGCQARLSGDGADSALSLPAIPAGAYQTVSADLPGPATHIRLVLACDGTAVAAAGPWGWAVSSVQISGSSAAARFVPLGADVAVVGVRARTAPPGETARVDVALVALRPLVDDIATSVRLMAPDGHWLARHDMQPALGAVPTLKWIRGSQVVDRHLLRVPADFADDAVEAALVAYERFRQTPLPVLDERFSQVPLGAWAQP